MPTISISVLVPHLQLQLEPRLCPMPHHTCLNANLDKGNSRPGPEIEIYLGRNAEPDASLCWRGCSPGEVTQVGDRHWMKRVLTRRAGTRVRFGRFEFRVFLCLPSSHLCVLPASFHHLPLSTTSSLSLELLAVNHSLFAFALCLDERTVCWRVSGWRTPPRFSTPMLMLADCMNWILIDGRWRAHCGKLI